ncbi:polyprenyl synthetase family protein [Sinimarinibacterium thermocellulolyticum]|uniref:Farnesyl diphosphate synthase n=1 Tax=Sinimarinibacterium thermocellulolyticum TaxID=3170016 RepID=A0ABV2A8N2_9GAMM
MSPEIEALIADRRNRLAMALDRHLPPAEHYPARLHQAMRYASEGGKRLRPLLVYLGGHALGTDPRRLDAAACAVEMIHAYSLVHDDLPAMDDDALRRGRPTTHVAYDEATAILVGDALQALAFQTLAEDAAAGLSAEQRLRMIGVLATAAGSRGMVGGQAVDLASEHRQLTLAELEALHIHKTGALIRACLQMAGIAADDASPAAIEALDCYGKSVGLAFQIQDDVLDIEGNSATLGKTAGKDHASGKSTYPSLLGLGEARRRADALFARACEALVPLGAPAEPLLAYTESIRRRAH